MIDSWGLGRPATSMHYEMFVWSSQIDGFHVSHLHLLERGVVKGGSKLMMFANV
jgi:hypothetical protein